MKRREKESKVQGKGMYPSCAKPAAMATMFCSAIPHFTSRSGKKCSKMCRPVELLRSASSATIRSFSRARSARAKPMW